ncbi:MAG: two-component system response regulator [Planctomycetes bacterium GWF2_40_8]|nr:MAG: two-component system response regulator [Planctomycetes bacterium GWF2_40_8]OHB86269.1 MAG: two-component system response regulator [Planctomycetes bacterium RIFCSPHIGHO2_02_FULL_40_12]OHC04777.1 MAG: two-component system response regulator [Planctomycetes bacterium RIFCSPLOWO2_12_FULL_40_19]
MNQLIAVIDDESDIVELVTIHLNKAMFKTKGFSDAESFYSFIEKQIPDLIILDLMLPDSDGLEICKYLRKEDKFSSIPIIMLTAKGEETDKILGLEFGADDYVTKPFSPRELVARVKAILRRRLKVEESGKLDVGGILIIDTEKYEVFVEGKRVELTSTEFRILKLFLSKKSKVFSRDDILDYLWGHEKIVLDRTIDVHIKHLRDKLGKAGRFIKNIRGVGYKLEE